jgi:hypothetical protein
MRLPMRDLIATLLVAVALLLYAAWAVGMDMPIVSSVSAVAAAILVLGIAASASAVVPGFLELLRGSKTYLAATSVLGLVAFGAGLVALLQGHAVALGALIVATIILWALSTNRHVSEGRAEPHLRH